MIFNLSVQPEPSVAPKETRRTVPKDTKRKDKEPKGETDAKSLQPDVVAEDDEDMLELLQILDKVEQQLLLTEETLRSRTPTGAMIENEPKDKYVGYYKILLNFLQRQTDFGLFSLPY